MSGAGKQADGHRGIDPPRVLPWNSMELAGIFPEDALEKIPFIEPSVQETTEPTGDRPPAVAPADSPEEHN